jgi:GNAT superfamily N-acetyltransferase
MMSVSFRQARESDLAYCQGIYFAEVARTIGPVADLEQRRASFRDRWEPTQARIIIHDGGDVGWLQVENRKDAFFLKQLFVDVPFQRRGIGSEVVMRLINEALDVGQPLTLGVVKTNPALRLYQRLGFEVTHSDDRSFFMRRGVEQGRARTLASPTIQAKPSN